MPESLQKIMWEVAEAVFTTPPEERNTNKMKSILVWFRQRSPIFENLEDDTVMDLIKNVKLSRYRRDNIIVRQGEQGTCLHIILKGSVSVYAKKEGEGEISQETNVRSHKERVVLFGTELSTLKAGRPFGESVIRDEKKERNATVISDEATMLISIDVPLYRRCLMGHNIEWKNKTEFVNNCSLFSSWPQAYKSLLVENLRTHKVNFGNLVVKQNTSCQSVFFIAKGMGKVIVDPCVAAKQYKRMKTQQQKKVETSEQGSSNLECDEDDVAKALSVIEKRRKRLMFGYVAEERRQQARTIHVAVIGENDIIGGLEMILDLPAYSTSVECLESMECYELDKPSFHRLIVKRNPETLEKIRRVAIARMKFRARRLEHVPYYGLLLEKALDDRMSRSTKSKSSRPKSVAHALIGFMAGKNKPKTNDFFKRLNRGGPGTTGMNDKNAATAASTDTGETRDNPQDRRRDKKDNKKQYTAEEFRALKKKVQSTGKLIGRISD